MEIAGLQQIYAKHPNMKGLADLLQRKDIRTIFLEGTHASSPSFFASAYVKEHPGVNLFVLNDQEEAGYFYHDMVQANGDADILFFPSSYRRAIKYGQRDAANEILKGDIATDGMTVNGEGLVLELNGYKTVASTDLIGTAGKKLKTEDNSIGNEFTISSNSTSTVNTIQVWKTEAQANGLNNGSLATGTNKNIKVTGNGTIEIGTSGTITLYFVDALCFLTEAPIKFTKDYE